MRSASATPPTKSPRSPSRCRARSAPTTRAPSSRRRIEHKRTCGRHSMKQNRITALAFACAALAVAPASAQMQKVGDSPEASNMRLVGYSDLQARSAYQPTIHHQGDRWMAYIGHHGGTPDVPKPRNPVTGAPDWRTRRMTQVYDLGDPAHPVKIRDFGLAGQEPGLTGAVPTELHGPISTGPAGNRIYFAYGTNKGGVLQIVDRAKLLNGPKEPTPENLRYPEVGRLDMLPINGAHTTFPLLKMPIAEFAHEKLGQTRDIVMIVDEEILNECLEPRQMVWFADVTIETRPMVVSSYTASEASGNFCQRGGRFGAHSSNEFMPPMYDKKLVFVTFFNGGVRAIDVRDPYHPKEAGYFVPAITEKTDERCTKVDCQERCKVAH